MPGELLMWTIYDHPADFPHGYIALLWSVTAGKETPTGHTMSGRGEMGLHMIRSFIQNQGYDACIARSDGDDPVILETWL